MMVRRFRVHIETTWTGVNEVEFFEMPDDATEKEIEDEAREIFFNSCNYSVSEVLEEEQ